MPNQTNPYAPPVANLDVGEQAAGADQPATRWNRFAAAFVDGLILIPFVVISVAIGVVGFGLKPETISGSRTWLVLNIFCVLPMLSYQWYLVTKSGQTIGKRWAKIKIVKVDGSPVDFVSGVALRNWILLGTTWLCSLVGLSTLAGLANFVQVFVDPVFIFGPSRRCLHDYIAGTKVITVGPAQ